MTKTKRYSKVNDFINLEVFLQHKIMESCKQSISADVDAAEIYKNTNWLAIN